MPRPSGIRHRCPAFDTDAFPYLFPEAVRQHIPGHHPALASPLLVPRLNQSLCGSSPVPPTEGRSSGSGPSQEVLGSPQPRVFSNTTLGCCPGAPPNSRFFGEHCGPNSLASERLHKLPLQFQVGGVLSFMPSTESRSCLSQCALSGSVLGAFVQSIGD